MVMAVPSRLGVTFTRLVKNPLLLGMVPVLGAIFMMVRWSLLRASRGAGAGGLRAPDYHRLPGQSRRDFLKLYRRVERLVRRRTGHRRMPWQTAESYADQASTGNTELSGQLRWFTRTM